jgi:hypothetical protein
MKGNRTEGDGEMSNTTKYQIHDGNRELDEMKTPRERYGS